MKMHKSKGFTLIELMIVIGIIGVLMAIAVPQYQTYSVKAAVTSSVGAALNPFKIDFPLYASKNGGDLPPSNTATDLDQISSFDEPGTCSGIVKQVTWTRDGTDSGKGILTFDFYTNGGAVNAACRHSDAQGTIDVPAKLAGNDVKIGVQVLNNKNVAFTTIISGSNASGVESKFLTDLPL